MGFVASGTLILRAAVEAWKRASDPLILSRRVDGGLPRMQRRSIRTSIRSEKVVSDGCGTLAPVAKCVAVITFAHVL